MFAIRGRMLHFLFLVSLIVRSSTSAEKSDVIKIGVSPRVTDTRELQLDHQVLGCLPDGKSEGFSILGSIGVRILDRNGTFGTNSIRANSYSGPIQLGEFLPIGRKLLRVVSGNRDGATLERVEPDKHPELKLTGRHIIYARGGLVIDKLHQVTVEKFVSMDRTSARCDLVVTRLTEERERTAVKLERRQRGDSIDVGGFAFELVDVVPPNPKAGIVGWVSLSHYSEIVKEK